MKFTCQKGVLQDAIAIASKAVTGNTNNPILKGILLESMNSQLRMTGADNDITIQTSIDVDFEELGSVVLDAKIFGDIIRNLPDDTIHIGIDTNLNTEINCQNVQFKIKGLNSDEYPKPIPINQEENFVIEQETLKNMIRQTIFSVSTDIVKPILTGVLFEINDDEISLVAVDGYRLALRKSKINANSINLNVVVPAKALNEVLKLLGQDGEAKVYISNNYVLFDLGNSSVYSKLLDGEFLKYKDIIQSDFKTNVRVKTKNIQAGVERAALIISSKDNKSIPAKVDVKSDNIYIYAKSDIGEVYEEVPCLTKGKELQIGFNPRYLIDVLKNVEDEEIYINFGSSISPFIINSLTQDNYTYLILPIRLRN
jgi:DNA polymerase-3 subunit beta